MMAHVEGCIAVIRDSKGNNLREVNGKNVGERDVFLKFGEEYSIYLKNKTPHIMGARISIDGTDVLGGSLFMVQAHGSSEIERFVVDGDIDKGKKFKFVSLASEHEGIVDPDSLDNGLIEIDFYKEQEPHYIRTDPPVYIPYPVYPNSYPYYPTCTWTDNMTTYSNTCDNSSDVKFTTSLGDVESKKSFCRSVNTACTNISDNAVMHCSLGRQSNSVKASDGATVEGKTSTQKFASVNVLLESCIFSSIKIRLRGHKYSSVTTKDKKYCSGCKVKVRWDDKFCPECGFELKIEVNKRKFCSECGLEVGSDHKHCQRCGNML